MRTRLLLIVVATGALSCQESPEVAVQRLAVASPAPPAAGHAENASARFREHFLPTASIRVRTADDDDHGDGTVTMSRRPSFCVVTGDGDVYLGTPREPRLFRWSPAEGRILEVEFAAGAAPERPVWLSWDDRESALYVLDPPRKQVRKYAPSGTLLDFVAFNAGQEPTSFEVLGDGTYLLGGPRWEDIDHAKLLVHHDAGGRMIRTYVDMDTLVAQNTVQNAPSVLMARAGDGFIVGEPGVPVLTRLHLDGRTTSFGEGFEGYRPMPPIRDEVIDYARIEAWSRSWTPLAFLHHDGRLTYAAFATWSGARREYRLEVYDEAGARVASGLVHQARPLCGRGDEIVFVARGSGASFELTRYRFDPRVEESE